jgi:CubicO group peptidase (beta-lactamase class C family)
MRNAIAILVMVLGMAAAEAKGESPGATKPVPRPEDAVAAWTVWVEHDLGAAGVPGASYAFVHGDRLLAAGGLGLADPESATPATADTLYSICSISKLFTSIAVLQLRDAGALDLDDGLAEHLPWLAGLADAHPDDEAITIRLALTHSAGLPRESDFPYWAGPDFPFPSADEIRNRINAQRTLYPSGRYFQYSNLGMTLLGEVVAARSGRPWAEAVREGILAPLGMGDTFTSVPEARATGRLAVGFAQRRGSPARERLGPFDVAGVGPAAGMASSAADLAVFARWQLRLRAAGGDEVLRAATLREMQRVHWVDPDWKTTWGLGFEVVERDGTTWVGHGGACPGYYSEFGILPEKELGVVVLANAIGAEVGLYARKAAALLEPALEKDPPAEQPARDPGLEPYLGVYDSVWGRTAIVRWGDGLAAVDLVSRSVEPDGWVEPLVHETGSVFRRRRADDGSLGEEWIFAVDEAGRATAVTVHSTPMAKVR